MGIAVSSSNLYVANSGAGVIGKYSTAGVTVNTSLISGLDDPSAIAVSGSSVYLGSLNAANDGSSVIGKYTTSGGTTNPSLVTGWADPRGIAVSSGNLYIASDPRTIPDVAADSGVGVWCYDSYNDTNNSGNWFGGIGGTSLAAPMWAGLIAVADQGRAEEGLGTLTGYSQTLPDLYALSSSDFHDITSGSNGTYSAAAGYDLVSGLGSPIANLLVPDLDSHGSAAELTVVGQPPSSVPANNTFSLTVAVEDSNGIIDPAYNGSVSVSLGNNPGGSTLGGTLTTTAVDGVATFSNLTLNNSGTGYTLHVTQSGLASATTNAFNVTSAAPVVTPSGAINTWTVGGAAVAIDAGVTVTASDSDLSGGSLTISSGTLQSGDTLHFTNQNGITGSYNSGTGTLTLTGSATVAQYQAALESITFSNASNNPSKTTRAITMIVDDGATPSNSRVRAGEGGGSRVARC